MFLLLWAMVATVVAGYYNYEYHRAMKGGVALCTTIEAVADGEAHVLDVPVGVVVTQHQHAHIGPDIFNILCVPKRECVVVAIGK